jgi:hypothetical protein
MDLEKNSTKEAMMKNLGHLLICIAFAFSLGCATKAVQEKGAAMPDPHADIFAEKCAKCHDLARVEEAHKTKTKAEMREIIQWMHVKPGSNIDQDELEEILEYY